jgi:hypothetical protein
MTGLWASVALFSPTILATASYSPSRVVPHIGGCRCSILYGPAVSRHQTQTAHARDQGSTSTLIDPAVRSAATVKAVWTWSRENQ